MLTAYTIVGNQTDAIQHGVSVLTDLGEDFPIDKKEQRASSAAELVRVCGLLKSKSFDDIVGQTIIENDYTKILSMQVLMVVTRIAYLNDPTLMLLLVFRMVSKSMTSGLTAEASFAFAALSFCNTELLGQSSEILFRTSQMGVCDNCTALFLQTIT